MKKFLLLACLISTVFNCSNEIEFNENAFQVTKNNEFWKAAEFSATIEDNGFIKIVGVLGMESITLFIESTELGVYEFGISNSSAFYINGEEKAFTTEYRGNGQIILEAYNFAEQSFSGTFKFNAFSGDNEVANFINGVFYQVPLVTDIEIEKESELKATVDESEIEADEVEAVNVNGIIEVLGEASDGRHIKLFIPETIVAGSYNLNEQSDSGTYAVYGFANGATSTAQYGTLFISEHDLATDMLKGTFTFTTLLPNSASVENGSFKVYY